MVLSQEEAVADAEASNTTDGAGAGVSAGAGADAGATGGATANTSSESESATAANTTTQGKRKAGQPSRVDEPLTALGQLRKKQWAVIRNTLRMMAKSGGVEPHAVKGLLEDGVLGAGRDPLLTMQQHLLDLMSEEEKEGLLKCVRSMSCGLPSFVVVCAFAMSWCCASPRCSVQCPIGPVAFSRVRRRIPNKRRCSRRRCLRWAGPCDWCQQQLGR